MHTKKIRRFMIAFNKIDELYYAAARRLGVKGNFFVLFYALADGRTYSQKQICDDWSLPRTTLNSIVRECAEKGYVSLMPRGNKEKDILLTPAGRKIADKVFGPLFAAEAEAMEPFLKADALERIERMAVSFQQSFAKFLK